MPETRQDNQVQPEKLGAQIDGLIDQMEAAANDVARELMGESPPTGVEPTVVPEDDEPADDAPDETDAPTEPEPAAETDAAELDEQVGKLVDEAIETAEEPEPPASIGSLDDELAALADDLLANDTDPVEGAITGTPEPVERQPEPEPEPALDPEAVTGATEPPATNPPAAEPIDEPADTHAEPVRYPTPDADDAPAVEPKPSAAKELVRAAQVRVLSASIAAVELAGRPLASKSPTVRHTVGWLAVWQLFIASIVWGWVLFLAEPSKPMPDSTAPTLVVPQETPGN